MTFSPDELHQIDVIKLHMVAEMERKNVVYEGTITDDLAIRYALGVTDAVIKQQYDNKTIAKQKKKNNIVNFRNFVSKK